MTFAIVFSAFFESWMAGSLNGFTMFFVLTVFFLTYKEFTQGEEDETPIIQNIQAEQGQVEYAN
jgi:hypothetical protein